MPDLATSAYDLEIAKGLKYNPKATNWSFMIGDPDIKSETSKLLGPEYDTPTSAITNMPNTLVIEGHGQPRSTSGSTGIFPHSDNVNDLALEIRKKAETTGAGVTLDDIAKQMRGATNDVKRVLLMSCWNAGYSLDEIKSRFPNAEQILSTSTNLPTSGYYLHDLFKSAPSYSGAMRGTTFSPIINSTKTNIVNQASDWMNPAVSNAMKKYIK